MKCYFCRKETKDNLIRCEDCADAKIGKTAFSLRTQDRIKNIDNFKKENNLDI